MSSKLRKNIKREAFQAFAPDMTPCFTYGGRILTNEYDRSCYLEGWNKAQDEYDSYQKDIEDQKGIEDQEDFM